MSTVLTDAAFGEFRANFPEKSCKMNLVRDPSELKLMCADDGLSIWQDGPGTPPKPTCPLIEVSPRGLQLWVVRPGDVPHATEQSPFSEGLVRKVIKHSNLTGGEPAHCGGELVFFESDIIALNGNSGRYGPSSEAEMNAVAAAFKESGYGVWSLGYDQEAARPHRFGDVDPVWVR